MMIGLQRHEMRISTIYTVVLAFDERVSQRLDLTCWYKYSLFTSILHVVSHCQHTPHDRTYVFKPLWVAEPAAKNRASIYLIPPAGYTRIDPRIVMRIKYMSVSE
jgi:hypothetical protein